MGWRRALRASLALALSGAPVSAQDASAVKEALNKVDTGFFLLLDKNEQAPPQTQTREALNKVDTGFFLLLDKNEPPKTQAREALNKVDTGFFLLLDKNEPPQAASRESLNKVDVGFFLLLDKAGGEPASELSLGKRLFFDPRLSSNKTMSCASCHNPSLAWRDGLPRARGLNGVELARRTPTLLNVHHVQQRFGWDGKADTVEQAALNALTSRLEMNRDVWELVRELNRIPDYARQFTEVYGLSGITPDNIAKAVASFVKAEIRPAPTAFDRFREDPAAMSASAQRGLVLFTGKGRCVLCHTGPGLSDGFFHNTGLKPVAGLDDPGRYSIVPNPADWRAFKTVPLRNVALTAPYMHDGSIATLREVIEFYDRGGDHAEGRSPLMRPLKLSAGEKEDLLSFLHALTSPQQPVAAPALPVEAEPPSTAAAASWNAQRARMIERDLKEKARMPLAMNAAAMRENADAGRRRHGPERALAEDCLREGGELARRVEREALGKGEWGALEREARALVASADRCAGLFRRGRGEALRETLAAADRVLDEGEAAVKALALAADAGHARRVEEGCRAGFSAGRLLKSLGAKGYAARLPPAAVEGLQTAYQYRAYAAMKPEVCDELAPVEKHYFGISRTAAWGCREWYWDMAAANALTTRNGRFEEVCRHSVAHDYPSMTAQDGVEICGVIARGIDRPESMCRELVPKYLGPETMGACYNEFARYSRDADVGRTQSGVPDSLHSRYVALDRYVRAHKAKDAKECGDSELCRVLMGEGRALAERYEAGARDAVCAAEGEAAAAVDLRRPRALIDRGGELLAAAEQGRGDGDRGSARAIDERLERLARLRLSLDRALEESGRRKQAGLRGGADGAALAAQ